MGKIPRISLKLNFAPNTLGSYGLKSFATEEGKLEEENATLKYQQ